MLAPFIWEVDNFAARLNRFDRVQRIEQNLTLLNFIEWFAERIPHREIDEYRARRSNLRAQIAAGRDYNGWDACFLYHSRYQTNGLVIERSSGHQDEHVDCLIAQSLCKRGRSLIHHCTASVDASHEAAVVMRSDFTDHAFVCQFVESLDREKCS